MRPMAESYRVSQGSSLTIDVTLRDASGAVVTGYDASRALATTIWPGGNRAAASRPTTTWTDPSLGLLAIAIGADDTAALAPGRYQLVTRLDDAGATIDAYRCTLDVTQSHGIGTTPGAYCSYQDLLDYGGPWLDQLSTDDDQAGFAEKIARARSWIDDLAHAHHRVGGYLRGGGGPSIVAGRSTTLQAWLDADSLLLTDSIKEACAKKALALICEKQIGNGDSAMAYARLARLYHAQADYLATCLTLGLDTDGDGRAEVVIDLSTSYPLYG